MPKGQVKAIEALGGEHREIARPHLAIVVPGLILDVACKQPGHTANRIRRPFDYYFAGRQGTGRIARVPYLIGQFEQRIFQAARILSAAQQDVSARDFGRYDAQALRNGSNRYCRVLQVCSGLRPRTAILPRGYTSWLAGASATSARTFGPRCPAPRVNSPSSCSAHSNRPRPCYGVGGIDDERDSPRRRARLPHRERLSSPTLLVRTWRRLKLVLYWESSCFLSPTPLRNHTALEIL